MNLAGRIYDESYLLRCEGEVIRDHLDEEVWVEAVEILRSQRQALWTPGILYM